MEKAARGFPAGSFMDDLLSRNVFLLSQMTWLSIPQG